MDNQVIVAAKDEGTRDIGVAISLGHRFPLVWGAHGKSIVAFLQAAERENALGNPRPYFDGAPSCFDPHRLQQEMAECKQSGFAVVLGGIKEDVHAVASPVFGPNGKLVGSFAVVGAFPPGSARRHGSAVAAATKKFSASIRGAPPRSLQRSGGDR